jgi:hypothetical protein
MSTHQLLLLLKLRGQHVPGSFPILSCLLRLQRLLRLLLPLLLLLLRLLQRLLWLLLHLLRRLVQLWWL